MFIGRWKFTFSSIAIVVVIIIIIIMMIIIIIIIYQKINIGVITNIFWAEVRLMWRKNKNYSYSL